MREMHSLFCSVFVGFGVLVEDFSFSVFDECSWELTSALGLE